MTFNTHITKWYRTEMTKPDNPNLHIALRYHNGALSPLVWFWDRGDLVWRAVIDVNARCLDDDVRDWSYAQ